MRRLHLCSLIYFSVLLYFEVNQNEMLWPSPYFTYSGHQVAPCDQRQLGTAAADKNPAEAAALGIIQQSNLR